MPFWGGKEGGVKRKMNKRFYFDIVLLGVLVFGILFSLALSQYRKAVLKSHIATLLPIVKSIAQAEDLYFSANGTFTENLDDLNISLPGFSAFTDRDGDLAYSDGEGKMTVVAGGYPYGQLNQSGSKENFIIYIGLLPSSGQSYGKVRGCADASNELATSVIKSMCKGNTWGSYSYGMQKICCEDCAL